jgi:hypothetical protein
MAESTLAQAQQLVDQLTPRDQVCLLAYLTTRLAQVVSTLPPTTGETPPEPSDVDAGGHGHPRVRDVDCRRHVYGGCQRVGQRV